MQAREEAPDLDWRVADLTALDTGEVFDVVLVAGNTIPLLEPRTLDGAARHLAAQLDAVVGWSAVSALTRPTCPAAAPSPRWRTSKRRSPPPASNRSRGSRRGIARHTTMTSRVRRDGPQASRLGFSVLALDAMVDQDLFICPRCGSPVRPEDGAWHCAGASCGFADQPFPVVSGVPALVDFEASVLDADRLRAVEGASEVRRSRPPDGCGG